MPESEQEKEIRSSSNKSEEEEDPFDVFQEDSFSLFDDEDDEDEDQKPIQLELEPLAMPEPAIPQLQSEKEQRPSDTASTDNQESHSFPTVHTVKPAAESKNSIPITLAVEIARIEVPLQTLTELIPGYTLNLEAPIDSGVTLIANGKAIGVGELLKIGDVLGVRIVKINK